MKTSDWLLCLLNCLVWFGNTKCHHDTSKKLPDRFFPGKNHLMYVTIGSHHNSAPFRFLLKVLSHNHKLKAREYFFLPAILIRMHDLLMTPVLNNFLLMGLHVHSAIGYGGQNKETPGSARGSET